MEKTTMRKTLVLAILSLLIVGLVPAVHAAPSAQFAGCADEDGMTSGAHYKLIGLNGLSVTLTAIGADGFDPAITVIDAEGNIVTCNDNSRDTDEAFATLPTIEATASENTASVKFNVPGDQGRLDYDVYVTSPEGVNGEFLLIYSGAEVFGSDDVDRFQIITNAGQNELEVPIGVYVANLKRPDLAINPQVNLTLGETFEQECRASSSRSLCDGDSEDLTGFIVKLDNDTDETELFGDDVMLFISAGGVETAEFGVAVSSVNAASFGAYHLMIHSGTGYPEAE
jgi:hypothetical protein